MHDKNPLAAASSRSILIVEDERIVAADLRGMLSDMGHDVYAVASSAAEALTRAAERAPDLALMDINIKGAADGVEAAAQLRERYGTAIVFLSAFTYESQAQRVKRAEPYGYLVKPVTSALLESTIELALRRQELDRLLQNREQQLIRYNVQMSTLIDHIPIGVLLEDENRRIQHANREFCAIIGTGDDIQEIVGADGGSLAERVKRRFAEPEKWAARVDELVAKREGVSSELVTHADGRIFDRAYVPMLYKGVYCGQVWTYRDVSVRVKERVALEISSVRNKRISLIDELTGLHNRRGFNLTAEDHLKARRDHDRQIMLFFFDLDGLKATNDTLGHDVGDQAICDMAAILKNSFRDTDVIARLGGDEFVVLASMDASRVTSSITRLRERLAAFNAEGGRPYALEVSIGAVSHMPHETLEQLLIRADAAMYVEKRAGKVLPGGPPAGLQ